MSALTRVDVVVLTSNKVQFVADDDWVHSALDQEAELVRTEEWGRLTERRVRLSSGQAERASQRR